MIPIAYQDAHLIVVDKPSGLLSVPGRGPDKQDCAVNRVKRMYPDLIPQPAVHRLDMDTSGLMLLARTSDAHKRLSIQFEQQQVHKTYIAIVDGVVDQPEGEIRLAFRLDPDNRPFQVYDPKQGKLGITQWKRIRIEGDGTRILFQPVTGRTHQLRLHAAHPNGLGAPIMGDRLYGHGKENGRLQLHAAALKFTHPQSGVRLHVTTPVPF